jgi:hypothetical protein
MKRGTLINLGVGTVLILVLWATLAPVEALALPPRPEDVASREEDDGGDDSLLGAYIELHLQSAPAGLWAIVQWQDSAGAWHDVEGWHGTLDASGSRRWWVAAKDFGTGPFRWVIYWVQGDELLAESDPFNLPQTAGETVKIEVSFLP